MAEPPVELHGGSKRPRQPARNDARGREKERRRTDHLVDLVDCKAKVRGLEARGGVAAKEGVIVDTVAPVVALHDRGVGRDGEGLEQDVVEGLFRRQRQPWRPCAREKRKEEGGVRTLGM